MNMFNIDEVNAYLEGKIYDNSAENGSTILIS